MPTIVEEGANAIAALASQSKMESDSRKAEAMAGTVLNERLLKDMSQMQASIYSLKKTCGGGGGGGTRRGAPAYRGLPVKETVCLYNPKSIIANYCWTHGVVGGKNHTSSTCTHTDPGHTKEETRENTMSGSIAGNTELSGLK